MNPPLFRKSFVKYLIVLSVVSWFIFNHLINTQSKIMYQSLAQRPPVYHMRVTWGTQSILNDFKRKMTNSSISEIKSFLEEYNSLPSFSVDFLYKDKNGKMRSVLQKTTTDKLVKTEYAYPARYGNNKPGKLLIYDINKQMKKRFEEYRRVTSIIKILFVITLILLLSNLLFNEYNLEINKQKKIIESQKRLAEDRARHDAPTGLHTQQYFKDRLQEEINKANKHKYPIALIMCDIDNFKQFNDTHGHLAGDEVLKSVANILKKSVRSYDIVARYGGEEFAMLLFGTDKEKLFATRRKKLTDVSIVTADRIRKKVESVKLNINNKKLGVTISMGIAIYEAKEAYKTGSFINEADSALYESKNTGRNCITIFDSKTNQFHKCS